MNTIHLLSDAKIDKAVEFAEIDNLPDAITLVEEAYMDAPLLRDGFARIGNVYCFNGRHDIALKLFERDGLFERLSPPYRHIFAYLLAQIERTNESLSEISRACLEDPSLLYGYSLVDKITGKVLFHRDQDSILHKDENIVADEYRNNSILRDGYSFIGSIHRAFAHFEKALYYYELDKRLDRLTPANRIILASLLTRFRRIKEAEEEVQCAYAEDAYLRDGFALIGSVFRNEGRYEEALPYYKRDRRLNRLSPANRHIFADQLARAGSLKEAENEVLIGYAEDSSLRNGYARIGNIHRAKSQFADAIKYYEYDHKEARLTPAHMVIYAELLSIFGKINEALNELQKAYLETIYISAGYARCAWRHYWPKKEYEKTVELIEIDKNNNRLSAVWMLNYAQACAAVGKIEKALGLVADAYRTDSTLKDGYSRCAWQYYWPKQEYNLLTQLLEKDLSTGKISIQWVANLLKIYAKAGHVTKFKDLYYQDNVSSVLSKKNKLELADIFLLSGNFEEARSLLSDEISKDENLKYEYKILEDLKKKRFPLSNIGSHIANMFDKSDGYNFHLVGYTMGKENILRILNDFKLVRKYCTYSSCIIDMGCVPPLLISLLCDAGYNNITAIDPAADIFINFFLKNNVKWHSLGLEDSIPDSLNETADMVCFCEVMEHLSGGSLIFLQKLCAMIKPGGILMITTPNLRSISGLYALIVKNSGLAAKPNETVRDQWERFNTQYRYFGHLREYTTKEVIDLFESFNMKCEKIIKYPPYKRGKMVEKFISFFETVIPLWRSNQQIIFKKIS